MTQQIARRIEALEVKLLPPPRSEVPVYLGAKFMAYLNGEIDPEAAKIVYANVINVATTIPFAPRNFMVLSDSELELVEGYLDSLERDETFN